MSQEREPDQGEQYRTARQSYVCLEQATMEQPDGELFIEVVQDGRQEIRCIDHTVLKAARGVLYGYHNEMVGGDRAAEAAAIEAEIPIGPLPPLARGRLSPSSFITRLMARPDGIHPPEQLSYIEQQLNLIQDCFVDGIRPHFKYQVGGQTRSVVVTDTFIDKMAQIASRFRRSD